jgi:pimeloyl-ACP methyl ester carboxylesterase
MTRPAALLAAACLIMIASSCTKGPAEEASVAPAMAAIWARWWPGYFAHKQAIRLADGRRIALYCEGSGGPLVMMEAGLGYGAWTWRAVQDQIARTSRTCTYDRAGYFRQSTPAAGPRDAGAEAEDLLALVKAAGLAPPYILVGHSYGGFIVRLFAYRHPEQVAGLVLVDPASEYQNKRMAKVAPEVTGSLAQYERLLDRCAAVPRPSGLTETCLLFPVRPDMPRDRIGWFVASQDPAFAATMLREERALDGSSSDELVAERRNLGSIPVILLNQDPDPSQIDVDRAAAFSATWLAMHKETMASISNDAELRIVPGSGHRIQRDRPGAVIRAVDDLIAKARARGVGATGQ